MSELERTSESASILEATAVLLTNPALWRQRVVEQVLPMSADHYELRRSFQFEIPPKLLTADDNGAAEVLLPVCWLAKHPLLEFDIFDGSVVPLHVLERRSIAGVLGQILDAWWTDLGVSPGLGIQATQPSSCTEQTSAQQGATTCKCDRPTKPYSLGENLRLQQQDRSR